MNYSTLPFVDVENEIYQFPEVVTNYILGMKGEFSMEQFLDDIFHLLDDLKFETLVFCPENKGNWLLFDDERRELREGVRYLEANGVKKDFDGGIIITGDERSQFFKVLFIMTTLNAAFPIVNFIDKNSNILAQMCQYGHLHVSSLNEVCDMQIKKFLSTSNLIEIDDNKHP